MDRLKNEGYYGGVRLLMAICKIFNNYCRDNKIDLHDRNFTLSYDTNIPRQVIVTVDVEAFCVCGQDYCQMWG